MFHIHFIPMSLQILIIQISNIWNLKMYVDDINNIRRYVPFKYRKSRVRFCNRFQKDNAWNPNNIPKEITFLVSSNFFIKLQVALLNKITKILIPIKIRKYSKKQVFFFINSWHCYYCSNNLFHIKNVMKPFITYQNKISIQTLLQVVITHVLVQYKI